MTRPRTVVHSSFTIERTFDAPPARVFAAWADLAQKRVWFHGPDAWPRGEHTLDFRVGGREHAANGPEGGPRHIYDALYQDIVKDQRIVTTYTMREEDTLYSISVATMQFEPHGKGTRFVMTEQGAFLDGTDWGGPSREQGTRQLLDQLAASLG